MSEEFPHELPTLRLHTASGAHASPLLPLRGGADGPAGLLLAVCPGSISYVSSFYDTKLSQSLLRLHMNNARIIEVFESDAALVLKALGLGEFVEDWTLNLERDLS
jgi:hypothetical protein